MIRREHIKQAVDAISGRDPEIGYSLDELLAMGLIDAAPGDGSSADGNLYFLFQGQSVLVNRVLFFQQGTAPIEQGLLIKFGELMKRQEIQERGEAPDYPSALREIHQAGLRLAAQHEVDRAIGRLQDVDGRDEALKRTLERIKIEDMPFSVQEGSPNPAYLYQGMLDIPRPAFFMCLPYSMESLMQIADLNLEFFHVRFVLNCLVRGLERNLLACVVQNRIVGLVFLATKEQFLKTDVEIKYIATERRNRQDSTGSSIVRPKGVGTFLVAGVWMLVHNEMHRSAEIVLDAEAGARGFYESIGFEARGFSGFVLRRPKPNLLRSLLGIARNHRDLRPGTVGEIASMIKRHVKILRKNPATDRDVSERGIVVACIRECFKPDSRVEFVDAALRGLLRYRRKILESEELLRHASEQGF